MHDYISKGLMPSRKECIWPHTYLRGSQMHDPLLCYGGSSRMIHFFFGREIQEPAKESNPYKVPKIIKIKLLYYGNHQYFKKT